MLMRAFLFTLALSSASLPVAAGVKSVSGSTPYGLVQLSLTKASLSCGFASAQFTMESLMRVVDFTLDGCETGEEVTIAIAAPLMGQWLFFSSTHDNPTPHWWSPQFAGSGSSISVILTDGADGDSDLIANGRMTVRGELGLLWGDPVPLPTPVPAPAQVATRMSYVDGPNEFDVGPGAALTGLRAATVDDAGNRIAYQSVEVRSTCDIPTRSLPFGMFSDGQGIVTLPQFSFPTWPGHCWVAVILASTSQLPLNSQQRVEFNFWDPTVVWYVEPVDGNHSITATVSQVVHGLQFVVLNPKKGPVPNRTVSAYSGLCGAFGSSIQIFATADANGIVELPAWTAPAHPDRCRLNVGIPEGGVDGGFLTIDVHDPSIPDGETFIRIQTQTSVVTGRDDADPRGIKFRVEPNAAGGVSFLAYNYCHVCVEDFGHPFAAFAPAGGQALGPGTYAQVQRYSSTGGPNAGLLSGISDFSSQQCDTVTGSFVVHELVRAPDGWPTRFAADFEQHCNDGPSPLIGAVRFNSTVPYPAPPAPPPTVTQLRGSAPDGRAMTLSLAGTNTTCTFTRSDFLDPAVSGATMPLPTFVSYPYGMIDFRAGKCGAAQPVSFTVEFPDELPANAQWWKWGPTPNRAPHWYSVPASVAGKRISFTIADGDVGDDDLVVNNSIANLGLLGIPGGAMQDLWWSGPGENGWGISLIQHRDVLFVNLFAYDAQGAPTWYVMTSGTWNPEHTKYTGNVYSPKGSAFYAYDAGRFDIGAPIGTATFTFANPNQASFDYTISGVTGHKDITRLDFGPPAGSPTDRPLGDLWWAGSAQNGWGIAMLERGSTLFSLWFTYDESGKPTWFVMSGGEWIDGQNYRGTIYKAVGSPWLGAAYDVSRHHLTDVGTFRFNFSGDAATFNYIVDQRSGSIPLSRIPF
jgi:hypothetical protein